MSLLFCNVRIRCKSFLLSKSVVNLTPSVHVQLRKCQLPVFNLRHFSNFQFRRCSLVELGRGEDYLIAVKRKIFQTSSVRKFSVQVLNFSPNKGSESESGGGAVGASPNEGSKETIMKVLNVAEKNDAAKRIANLLADGQVQTRNTYSVYNKLYEFQYVFRNQSCHMTMTSVSGHLLNQEFDSKFRKWHSCDPVELFDAPVLKTCQENMQNIQKTLEQQAAYHQVLIIWTDCDREGENIGYEVISVCQRVNPRLQILRAKFSEMTKQAVTRAMSNLIQPDKRVSDAVDVRSELDLRIGAAFTRFQTLRLTRKFPSALADRLISYGSCQFPTLGFVVERYKAIQDFIRENFWKIDVSHKMDDYLVNFSWARVRLFDQLAVQTIYEMCLENPSAKVVKVQSKPKSKWRPVALDTIEFEKLSSRKLRIGAKEAMQIAEQLYTAGLISYPRTETNIFPPGLDLPSLVENQTNSNQWGGFATRLLQQPNGPTPRNGKKSDQAHPPIHPTKFDTLSSYSDKHKRIYELIVRHFLACCSKDAIGKETVVEIEIACEKFVTNGLTIIERNYLEVYIYDKWSDKELPDFHEGETFRPTKIELNEGQTSPPNLLTEADLIALMEKHGIGTDATHAEHIETIKNRQYVGLQGVHFVPGKLGMGLVEGYDAMGFEMSKPHLRAELEADLQRICEGRKNPNVVLREQVQKYKHVFIQAMDQVIRLDEALARLLNDGGASAPPPGNPGAGVTNRGGNNRRDDDDDDDSDDGNDNSRTASSLRNRSSNHTRNNSTTSRNNRVAQTSISTQQNLHSTQRHAPNNQAISEEVLCLCGTAPETKTTRKEGPNYGRQFYKCEACGFFQWMNETGSNSVRNQNHQSFQSSGYESFSSSSSVMAPPPPRQQRSNYSSSTQQRSQASHSSTQQSRRNNDIAGDIPQCQCNKPAATYTVKKEGVNKGRKFFGCAVPYGAQEDRCGFFQWDVDANTNPDDGAGNNSSFQGRSRGGSGFSNSYSGKGGSRGRGRGNAGGAKRARRCGICHQEGHTRRNCPVAGEEEEEEEDEGSY